MAGEAHSAEDVDFKETQPVGIRNFEKRFDLEDAEVVDEDIGFGDLAEECFDASCGAKVGGDAANVCGLVGFANFFESGIDTTFGAAVEDDTGAFLSEGEGDCESDSSGGTGYYGGFVLKAQVHLFVLVFTRRR